MRLEVSFEDAFTETLPKLVPSWRTQARICEAIFAFAESGSGDVRRVRGDEYRLRVTPYAVRFTVDRDAAVVSVWGIFEIY